MLSAMPLIISRDLSSAQKQALNPGSIAVRPSPLTHNQLAIIIIITIACLLGTAAIFASLGCLVSRFIKNRKKAKLNAKLNADIEAAMAAVIDLEADLQRMGQARHKDSRRQHNNDAARRTTIHSFSSGLTFPSEKTESVLYGLGIAFEPSKDYVSPVLLDHFSPRRVHEQAEADMLRPASVHLVIAQLPTRSQSLASGWKVDFGVSDRIA